MRAFLNAILSFIGSESLTDVEFDALTVTVQEYSLANYEALKLVLEAREGVSGQLQRLKDYFTAKGVDITAGARAAASQIFVGASLA